MVGESLLRCPVCDRPLGECREGELVVEHAGRLFVAPREITCKLGHRWTVVPTGSLPQLTHQRAGLPQNLSG